MPYTWMQCMTRAPVWVFVYADELVSKPVYVYVCVCVESACAFVSLCTVEYCMSIKVYDGGGIGGRAFNWYIDE